MSDWVRCSCGAKVQPNGAHIDERGNLTYNPRRKKAHVLTVIHHRIKIPKRAGLPAVAGDGK